MHDKVNKVLLCKYLNLRPWEVDQLLTPEDYIIYSSIARKLMKRSMI